MQIISMRKWLGINSHRNSRTTESHGAWAGRRARRLGPSGGLPWGGDICAQQKLQVNHTVLQVTWDADAANAWHFVVRETVWDKFQPKRRIVTKLRVEATYQWDILTASSSFKRNARRSSLTNVMHTLSTLDSYENCSRTNENSGK